MWLPKDNRPRLIPVTISFTALSFVLLPPPQAPAIIYAKDTLGSAQSQVTLLANILPEVCGGCVICLYPGLLFQTLCVFKSHTNIAKLCF